MNSHQDADEGVDGPSRRGRPDRREVEARKRAERAAARDARRARKRAELLDAAIGAIREDGPDVSMEALAAAGGVTKPILYRHFGDRNGLTAAIAIEFAGRLQTELADKLTGADEPEALLATTIDAYLSLVEGDPEVYRFITEVAASSPLGVEATRGFIDQVSAQIAIVIAERLRAAGSDPSPARVWAHAVVGGVHQAGDHWLASGVMSRAEVVAQLVDLYWGGLGNAAQPD